MARWIDAHRKVPDVNPTKVDHDPAMLWQYRSQGHLVPHHEDFLVKYYIDGDIGG